MAKDIFQEKLAAMIKKRREESKKIFEQEIKYIANAVCNCILNEDYEIPEDFLEAWESCKDCAKTCDAADNLCKYIFYNEDCKSLATNVVVKTISGNWKYNHNEFRSNIDQIFIDEGLDVKKGFVYIFWKLSPLKYCYVGKTDIGTGRLKEKKHTNVALSITSERATRLTVIYPKNNKIGIVEASIIRIIGELEHNEQKESFTEGKSDLSQKLPKLEKFFGQLRDKCK